VRTTSIDDLALEMDARKGAISDPTCWHADDGPVKAFRMLASAVEGDCGEVSMKIMGDTLLTSPESAIAFAEQLLSAAVAAMKTRKDP